MTCKKGWYFDYQQAKDSSAIKGSTVYALLALRKEPMIKLRTQQSQGKTLDQGANEDNHEGTLKDTHLRRIKQRKKLRVSDLEKGTMEATTERSIETNKKTMIRRQGCVLGRELI